MSSERVLEIPPLPVRRTAPARSALGRWLLGGGELDHPHAIPHKQAWYLVLWLTGVDYFSTLGYQPGIALLAAGALSPIATVILIAVTLGAALPVYRQVSKRSYAGQGSIAMLENLLSGWQAKLFVLILLGFAATDFVITMTLSAADAAQHAVENPYLHPFLGEGRILLTLLLLMLLSVVFLAGFVEAIRLAAAVAIPYIILNLIILARGLLEIAAHPEVWHGWRSALTGHGDWSSLLLASAIVFPRLALGMSGFETGVTMVPLVKGGPEDQQSDKPEEQIRNTGKLLSAAAVIMSFLLLLSSFVTTLLIPEQAYTSEGEASGRAIAYLAHRLLGHGFGTIYDTSTILILWFAGASAMAGLLNLIPRYLPRFGMVPRWVAFRRPLVIALFIVCLVVTLVFRADVEAQGSAYATGVLVLMVSAAVAVALALGKESSEQCKRRWSKVGTIAYFWIVTLIFAYTLVDNVIERSTGLVIASVFILVIVVVGALSRSVRSMEMRVSHIRFRDSESADLWKSIVNKKVHLVPLRTNSSKARRRKAQDLKRYNTNSAPLAFIHVRLLDNRSEFLSPLVLRVRREGDNFLLEIEGAVAIANTIAYVSELIDPITLFVGLTRQNLMVQALRYVFFGEGEIGLMVYAILVRYWEWTLEEDVRPNIVLVSE